MSNILDKIKGLHFDIDLDDQFVASDGLQFEIIWENDFLMGELFDFRLFCNGDDLKSYSWILGELDKGHAIHEFKKSSLHLLLTKICNQKTEELFEDLQKLNELFLEENSRRVKLSFDLPNKGGGLVLNKIVTTPIEETPYIIKKEDVDYEKLLNPKKIAIIGVSSKANSFGTIILNNLLKSDIDKKNLRVIKPGETEFLGVKSYEDITALKDDPVDVLILVLPSLLTLNTIIEMCKQGGGAEYIYIVAGGIGDQADRQKISLDIIKTLNEKRKEGKWTPSLIGPNSLGIILSSLKINTMFINEKRVACPFSPNGNTAFLSQSGAFLLTRYSENPHLPIKYGFCIGNQMDVNVVDFLQALSSDDDIKVVAVYLESLGYRQAFKFVELANKLHSQGKRVVVYVGGRNETGKQATAAHTGAIGGNYAALVSLFKRKHIYVSDSLGEFSVAVKWFSSYDTFPKLKSVAMLSNAGYETVRTADLLGDNSSNIKLLEVSEEIEKALRKVIRKHKLQALVSPANPFDMTPMADEESYLKSVEVFTNSEADVVILSNVPFTERIEAFNIEKSKEFAESVKQLVSDTNMAIVVVIEAGEIYNEYREIFSKIGLPVFRNVEECITVLNKGQE